MSLYISEFISYEEATKSPTALRLGISNRPDEEQIENMRYVAQRVFDPVRRFVGGPLMVTSFFRSKDLNKAIPGSSATSKHMDGEAIDIDADGYSYGSNLSIFHFIRLSLEFDQLIAEYVDALGQPAWVHVSLSRTGKNRKEVLVKLKSKYIHFKDYKVGMV